MIDPRIQQEYAQLTAARPEIRAYPADWEAREQDYAYIYKEGVVLLQAADLPAVQAFVARRLDLAPLDPDNEEDQVSITRLLGNDPDHPESRNDVPDGKFYVEHLPLGVTRLWYRSLRPDDGRPTAPELVAFIEQRIGTGLVAPEYAFHAAGRGCSAKEPSEVPPATFDPFPPPRRPARPGFDGDGVRVSIIDTGFLPEAAQQHGWLTGVTGDAEVNTYVDVGGVQQIAYDMGHGTFVAGVLRSIAPKATVRVEAGLAAGAVGFDSELQAKLLAALECGPDLIVCSFVTAVDLTTPPPALTALFDQIARFHKGVTVFAPAGNDGLTKAMWPAALPSVVAVGSLSTNWGERAVYSNHGSGVNLFAPGEDLVNAFATGDYTCKVSPFVGDRRTFTGMARWSGTSFATPLVAGLVAARMSATGETSRQATDAMLALARSQAVPGVGSVLYPDQADVGL